MSQKYSVKEKVSDDLVEQLLHNRGIKSKKAKETFLNPDFEKHLHNPFLLPDMDKAAERILKAIEKNERVAVWSDYDADGIPGGALLHDFFKMIGFDNFTNYIPCRHNEGHGLNKEGIEKLKEEKTKLLVTIDCGIRNNEEVKFAKKCGMEVIITDHHEPSDKLPEAVAVVDHKRNDSEYPEDILCGTGVVWKLIQALRLALLAQGKLGFIDGKHKWLLDLVGLATLSDMVPLVGENRVLAHYGMLVMRKGRRVGLAKLLSNLKINKNNLNEDDIAFMVTPRINAASRMGHAMDAFNLLVAESESEAEVQVNHLNKINDERKILVAAISKEAKKKIKEKFESAGEKPVIVLGNPDWRPAVLGLVAGNLAEEYHRPVFLWGRENGDNIKGSCRSDGVTDLVAIMEGAKDHFLEYGGHKLSGGFSVNHEKIHTFEEALLKASTNTVDGNQEILVDAELFLGDINESSVSQILKLAPFGAGNEKPLFIFHDVLPERVKRFGKNKEHLSVDLRDGSSSLRAISFFTSPDQFGDALKEGLKTNLVANVEKSFYNGSSEIRLRIVDFF